MDCGGDMLDRKARTANERQVYGMRQLPRPKRSEQLESSRARVPLLSNLSSSSPAWLELTPARSNTTCFDRFVVIAFAS